MSGAVALTEGQSLAADAVSRRHNILITGPAGTGKSFMLDYLQRVILRDRSYTLTASTGMAALLIGGKTVYSALGVGILDRPIEDYIRRIRSPKYGAASMRAWKRDVLILDELSMLSAVDFDKLESIAREVRRCPLPFGGMQLVLCGDFFQLPPVDGEFAFRACTWSACIERVISLTQNKRQQAGSSFERVLNKIRVGRVDDDVRAFIEQREAAVCPDDGVTPTELHAKNDGADRLNQQRYAELLASPGRKEHVFQRSSKLFHPAFADVCQLAMDKSMLPDVLRLTHGAQVWAFAAFLCGSLSL
jgi:ATP-dependent DNA helicase PIF1